MNKTKTATELSNETISQYKEVFSSLFDRDGDGLITPIELVNVLKAFGLDPTENEMLSLIKRVEIDSDSVIDFDEFLSLMTTKSKSKSKSASDAGENEDEDEDDDEEEEELREAFKMFDKDGNGFLDMMELEDLFTNLNEKLTEQEFQSAVKLIDTDGDGLINYHEFKQFIVASK